MKKKVANLIIEAYVRLCQHNDFDLVVDNIEQAIIEGGHLDALNEALKEDYLSANIVDGLCGCPPSESLYEAGYKTTRDVINADDKELLKVKGIGPGSLGLAREILSRGPRVI